VSSSVPSTVGTLAFPVSANGILLQRPVSPDSNSGSVSTNTSIIQKSEYSEKALKAGFLRMILDLLVWERKFSECEANKQKVKQIVQFIELKSKHKLQLMHQSTIAGETTGVSSHTGNEKAYSNPGTVKVKAGPFRGVIPAALIGKQPSAAGSHSSSAPSTIKVKPPSQRKQRLSSGGFDSKSTQVEPKIVDTKVEL